MQFRHWPYVLFALHTLWRADISIYMGNFSFI